LYVFSSRLHFPHPCVKVTPASNSITAPYLNIFCSCSTQRFILVIFWENKQLSSNDLEVKNSHILFQSMADSAFYLYTSWSLSVCMQSFYNLGHSHLRIPGIFLSHYRCWILQFWHRLKLCHLSLLWTPLSTFSGAFLFIFLLRDSFEDSLN
jgi:hypothetical protein